MNKKKKVISKFNITELSNNFILWPNLATPALYRQDSHGLMVGYEFWLDLYILCYLKVREFKKKYLSISIESTDKMENGLVKND